MRFNFRRLDEKTYTIGDTQYWRRNGKTFKWTESGGRKEIGEDEYMKAISTTNVKPSSSNAESKAVPNSSKRSVIKPADYTKASPEDLAILTQDGDKDAEEILISRYQPLVHKISNKYFLQGGDKEDLFQDGLIGLWDAIKSYDETKNPDFTKYAAMAIDARMKLSLRSDNTQKSSVLNKATSMDAASGGDGDDDRTLGEKLPSKTLSIEDEIMGEEGARKLRNFIQNELSAQERDIINKVIDGYKPAQIAADTGLPYKTVSNAIMRARAKIGEYTAKMNESKKEVVRKGNLRITFRKKRDLEESSFDLDGKTYTSKWGKYSCNGKPITKEEYRNAAKILADKHIDPQSFEGISNKPSKETSIIHKELYNFTKNLSFDKEYEIPRDTRGHLPRIKRDDKDVRVNLIMKDSGMNRKDSSDLNNIFLASTDTQKDKFTDRELGLLNKYLDNAPVFDSIPLYRGMGFKKALQDQMTSYNMFKDLKEGSITDFRGITSVSSNPDVAINFAQANGEFMVIMVITKNLSAVSIDCFTSIDVNEEECLYKQESKFRVVRKYVNNNVVFLQLEEIDLSESENANETITLPIKGNMIIKKDKDLDESGFLYKGKYYVSAFGNYTADGEKISKEVYDKASESYAKEKVSSMLSQFNTSKSDSTSHSKSNTDGKVEWLDLNNKTSDERHATIKNELEDFINNNNIKGRATSSYSEGHREEISPDDVVEDLVEDFGYSVNEARRLRSILETYTGDNIQPNSEDDKDLLDDLLDEIPVYYDERMNGLVYRGMSIERDNIDRINDIKSSNIGDTLKLRGYTSFSSDPDISVRFSTEGASDNLRVIIVNDKNLSGKSIKRYSHYPEEDEVLYKSTVKFVIKNKVEYGDLILLHVSEEELTEASEDSKVIDIGLEGNQHIYNKSDKDSDGE